MSELKGYRSVTAEEALASVERKRAERAKKRNPSLKPGGARAVDKAAASAEQAQHHDAPATEGASEQPQALERAVRAPPGPVADPRSNEVDWHDNGDQDDDPSKDDLVGPREPVSATRDRNALLGPRANAVTIVVPNFGVIELTPRALHVNESTIGLLFDGSVADPQFVPTVGAHISVRFDGVIAECLYAGAFVRFGSVSVMVFHRK